MDDRMTEGTRLRCAWEVHAGIIPDRPEPEFTRRWMITEEYWEKLLQEPEGESYLEIFRKEAYDYAASLTDPRRLNWVRIDWVWL